jgi:uncharacterized protein (TIGR00661 family)
MKFLFIVQGEGRGHLTQSISLSELLTRNGHEVVAVMVGKSNRRELPAFFTEKFGRKIRRFDSPNFLPVSKNYRTNILASIAYNIFHLWKYIRSIILIRKSINRRNIDAVVNFYELLTGLSYAILPPSKPCYCIAHQYLFLHPAFRFPNVSSIELWGLKFFTQVTCLNSKRLLALSIQPVENVPQKKLTVVPPLLRKEIFNTISTVGNYLHGYILNDNYAEEITNFHKKFPNIEMHFFWDRKNVEEETATSPNLTFHRLNDNLFIHYMSGCKAYATTAGFESVCEAMYMGKPVLMVPTHIEQECNAFEMSEAGAGIMARNFEIEKLIDFIPKYNKNTGFRTWVQQADSNFLNILTH